MPYTDAQLQAIYTQLNIGSAGPAVDQAAVAAIAAQTRVGQISDEQALQGVFDLVDDTTGVAALTYQFFTSNLPTEAGFQFLVNSATNPNDLNDPFYANFNQENRFINFSLNLALGTPANQTAFAAVFGGPTTLQQTMALAYETIIGRASAEARGIDVDAAIAFLTNADNVAFYRNIAITRGAIPASDAVRLDLAIKAIAIAELLHASALEDVGNYAASLDQFYRSLIDATPGSPGFGGDLLETFPPSATVTLTAFADTVVGNVFNAPRAFTPGGNDQVNTLNDDDVLTGVGANPTLNFVFVNDSDTKDTSIAPTLKNIQTINIDVRADSSLDLDLQDNTGVKAVNISGIDSANVRVDNINAAAGFAGSINNSNAPTVTVDFAFDADAVAGSADTATLTLNDAQVAQVYFQETGGLGVNEGIETLALVSTGATNKVGSLVLEDAKTVNITGGKNLVLGATGMVKNAIGNDEAVFYGGGFAQVAGSLTKVDASGFTANLDIAFGAEVTANLDNTSGVPVDFNFTGGAGNDTVRLLGGIDSKADVFDGGAGKNTFQVFASVGLGSVTKFQVLDIRGQANGGQLNPLPATDGEGSDQTITVDTGIFSSDLASIVVRNEGRNGSLPFDHNLTVNLNNLAPAPAGDISVLHGTSGNNGITDLIVNTTFKTATAADVLKVSITEGVNTDPRFNFTLNAASAETVILNDVDSESNSVRVSPTGVTLLQVTGGQTGKFLNLDTQDLLVDQTLPAPTPTAGLYQRDLTGGATDGTGIIDVGTGVTQRFLGDVAAGTFIGDLTVRVDAVTGKSYVMGSGNDTLIFDTNLDPRAGLTISDTADGGAGADVLAIDGNGTIITLGASEWTNVKNFETILLVGNGLAGGTFVPAGDYGDNAYNLRLTNDLIAANGSAVTGGRSIAIVNDSGNALTSERGVTIDARTLNAQSSFSYDGEEDVAGGVVVAQGATADRFIMSDANINGLAKIDGGAIAINGAGNADILEVRNSSIVTIGDLANIQNVSTIQFTNDTAVLQASVLELNDAVVEAMVNSAHTAKAGEVETLVIRAIDNPILSTAETEINVDGKAITSAFLRLDVIGGGGNDTIVGGAGNDVIQGDKAAVITPGTPQVTNIQILTPSDAGDSYTVTINGTPYTYTSLAAEPASAVAAGLVAAINAAGITDAQVPVGGDNIQLTGPANGAPFTVSASGTNSPGTVEQTTVTFAPVGGAYDAGDSITVTVQGQVFNIVPADDLQSGNAIANQFAALINASIIGVAVATASVVGGVLTLTGLVPGANFTVTTALVDTPDVADIDTVTMAVGDWDAADTLQLTLNNGLGGVSVFTQTFIADQGTSAAALVTQINANTGATGISAASNVAGTVITLTGTPTGENLTGTAVATTGVIGALAYNDVAPFGDVTDDDPTPPAVQTVNPVPPGPTPNPAPAVTTTPGTPAVVTGAVGADVLTGGGGADMFVFGTGGSNATVGAFDTITDFSTTSGDVIDFLDGAAGSALNYAEVAVGAGFAGALAAAQGLMAGAVRYVFVDNGADGFLFADVNGDTVIDYAVALTGVGAGGLTDFDFSDIG